MLAAVVTTLLTLGIGSALLVGATFGLAKAYAVMGLLWLGTIGLPTSLGVAGVAALWGRFPLLSGMAGFCVVAALAGLALQVLVFILAWRWLRSRERADHRSDLAAGRGGWRRSVLARSGRALDHPTPTRRSGGRD